jgi:transcriptional regulator with XRE-family HTH domain
MSKAVLGPLDRPAAVAGLDPMLRDVIGDVLRSARLAQGRTLKNVATEAGVSVPYLSEIERGRKEASSEILAAVCHALGLRLLDLVARSAHYLTITSAPVVVGSNPTGPTPRPIEFSGSVLALAA